MDSFKDYIKEEVEGTESVAMTTNIKFIGKDCAKDCPFAKFKGKFTRNICYWPGEIYKLKDDPNNDGLYLRHEDCLEYTEKTEK